MRDERMMSHEELQAAYDRLLLENERLKRIADDAREQTGCTYDSKTSYQLITHREGLSH